VKNHPLNGKPRGAGLNTNSNVSSSDNPLFGGGAGSRYANYAQQNAEYVKNHPINSKA